MEEVEEEGLLVLDGRAVPDRGAVSGEHVLQQQRARVRTRVRPHSVFGRLDWDAKMKLRTRTRVRPHSSIRHLVRGDGETRCGRGWRENMEGEDGGRW